MSRAESPEARAQRIIDELRQATAEAAGAAKDLERAAKAARAQVDEYLPREIERVVNSYVKQVQAQLDQWHTDMDQDVARHITNWTAVVQNDVSRGRIFREAVNTILAELTRLDQAAGRTRQARGPEVVIDLCDRPHAD